ncbi:1058_t:CDS:2 [Ambispora gerdemannii]|uniref:1058_t:CDS:1 n=1 Tax=Ambispora gerdemannii TaxID=144530 RepID=A0A9N9CKE3_9GLOM|nr:1058_t:CDS:2 [Ambispora gerdemannii]
MNPINITYYNNSIQQETFRYFPFSSIKILKNLQHRDSLFSYVAYYENGQRLKCRVFLSAIPEKDALHTILLKKNSSSRIASLKNLKLTIEGITYSKHMHQYLMICRLNKLYASTLEYARDCSTDTSCGGGNDYLEINSMEVIQTYGGMPKTSPLDQLCPKCDRVLEIMGCCSFCNSLDVAGDGDSFSNDDNSNWDCGNDQLDLLIRDSQNSAKPGEEYLRWITYNKFSNLECIGEGGFGTFEAAYSCRSRRIMQCLGITRNPNTESYIFALDLANGGNLRDFLHKRKKPLLLASKLKILRDIAIGLEVIHDANMVHRNLHSGNVLIKICPNGEIQAFISDLGLSRPTMNIEFKRAPNMPIFLSSNTNGVSSQQQHRRCHPEAIYKSRFLSFPNLPEPTNFPCNNYEHGEDDDDVDRYRLTVVKVPVPKAGQLQDFVWTIRSTTSGNPLAVKGILNTLRSLEKHFYSNEQKPANPIRRFISYTDTT